MKPEISVCIITRNEEKRLKRCLESLCAYPFELVVLDTGSTDDTRQVAAQYTEHVYEYTWQDDFAAAKNYAVRCAGNDIVFLVDSDEYLERLPERELELLAARIHGEPKTIGRVTRVNTLLCQGECRRNREWINRIYDRRYYHYEGRIHEQLIPGEWAIDSREERACESGLVLIHDGYQGDTDSMAEKIRRNRTMLLIELEKNPKDSYLQYQLGKTAYMEGRYEEAAEWFVRALEQPLDARLEYVTDLIETCGYALINSGQAQRALELAGNYKDCLNTADGSFLMGLIQMNNEHYEAAIADLEKATGYAQARTEGTNSYLAYYNAGVICECLGQDARACAYYRRSEGYERARQRLTQLQTRIRENET